MSYIGDAPVIQNIQYFAEPSAAKNIQGVFGYNTLKMRYIAALTFALNYKVHGLDVTGYHIVNLAIHLLTSMLVYGLASFIFKTPAYPLLDGRGKQAALFIPLFSGLLFVSHPIQTEAVTYISQRFTSLVTMFYLLSVVTYIRSRTLETRLWKSRLLYIAALACSVFAMKTKENAFTLPIIIALCEFTFFSGKISRRFIFLAPFLLTLPIIPLSLIDTSDASIIDAVDRAMRANTDMSRLAYLYTQFRVMITYIRLLIFPVNQNLDYDYPIYNSFFQPEVFLSFLVLLTLAIVGTYIFYRAKHSDADKKFIIIAFGIFWFFITMSVESSFIPTLDVIFEHRLYLPSVGFFIAAAFAIWFAWEKWTSGARYGKKVLACAMATIVFILSVATHSRNDIWTESVTLWEATVKGSPNKSRPHNNLGDAYERIGLTERAISEFSTALKISPNDAGAHYNLGFVYEKYGYIDMAINEYKAALSIDPNLANVHYSLGNVYTQLGNIDEAINEFQKVLSINPAHGMANKTIDLLMRNRRRSS
ncbi:MAG: tetratricopeptide repeat protein [Nitrospiraceae bacterium]|nr:tetratricopeptide repeat protein [Nitrospiraceae bacterium]